ncbi:MAG: tripartite tricarboxylate transporter substrate binding protein [Betaproteobacteria bacterium]|nr:tripartite tricarboxylate transporter substrate binding protein [Betaproteobacteria bacterium]
MKPLKLILAAAALAFAGGVHAQAFPTKPVTITIGFAPGSSIDTLTRLVAERLRDKWGQPVVVDNKPGAGANIAAEHVSKAAPDGYTLLVTTSAIAISPALYPKLNYDPFKDLRPVGQVSAMPHIFAVKKDLPVNTVAEFIAYAKANPGKMNFSSAGTGNSDHMAGELLKALTGIDMVHVPYKGGQQAMADLVGGLVDAYFPGLPVGLPMVKGDRVKALATTGRARSKALPDVPLLSDTVKGFTVELWYGMFAPAGVPDALVQKISADLAAALKDAGLAQKFDNMGVEPIGSDPKAFGEFVKAENEKWAGIIKRGNITLK